MLKLPCMFEYGCLFYTLANFNREQSNLQGIFFELKCSCRRFENGNSWPLLSLLSPMMTVAGIECKVAQK
jgi:hypothetical protein